MKVSKFKRVLKEQARRLGVKNPTARFNKDGLIVEACISNEIGRANSFFSAVRRFLVNEGIKIDRFAVSKNRKNQFAKYMISEATYAYDEENEENDTIVPDNEIEETDIYEEEITDGVDVEDFVDKVSAELDETEEYENYDIYGDEIDSTPTAADTMTDDEYIDYVSYEEGDDYDLYDIPDDEEEIEIVLADNIDSLESYIVDEIGDPDVKIVDINAHEGMGGVLAERRRRARRMLNERGFIKQLRKDLGGLYDVIAMSEEDYRDKYIDEEGDDFLDYASEFAAKASAILDNPETYDDEIHQKVKDIKRELEGRLTEGKMVKVNEGLDKLVKKEFNLLLLRNYQDVTPRDFVETILETIIEFSPKSKGSDGVDYTGAWSTGVISAFERLLKSKNWVVK